MREAKKNFSIFSSLTKFDKRWSTIMIMLESGGGAKLGSPPPSYATEWHRPIVQEFGINPCREKMFSRC